MSLRQSAAIFESATQRQSQPDDIRREIALRLASPKRTTKGQDDSGHLPLFVAANEPTLL